MLFVFLHAILLLLLAAPVLAETVDLAHLEQTISDERLRIKEFGVLATEAKTRGLNLYIFGGGAASMGEFAKQRILYKQAHGTEALTKKTRLLWEFNNIIFPEQDIDLVISKADGSPETAEEIQSFRELVRKLFPYTVDGRSRWDVLGLKTADLKNNKMALADNPDFLLQHNDSLSLGLIQLTPVPGSSVIKDLNPQNQFLEDLAGDKIHFIYSREHKNTAFYKAGRNPPILSVERALEKATRYNKQFNAEDLEAMKGIIEAFDPSTLKSNTYPYNYLMGRAKRIVAHAYDPETALLLLDQIGLRKKFLKIPGNRANKIDSLAWWLNKKPLPKIRDSSLLSKEKAKTAGELNMKTVGHYTSDLGHRLITWNFDNQPKLFESRPAIAGENAGHGNGFYTFLDPKKVTTFVNNDSKLVLFNVNPEAIEGIDFERFDNVVVWKNSGMLSTEQSAEIYPDNFACAGIFRNFQYSMDLSAKVAIGFIMVPAVAVGAYRHAVLNPEARRRTHDCLENSSSLSTSDFKCVPLNNEYAERVARLLLQYWDNHPELNFSGDNSEFLKKIRNEEQVDCLRAAMKNGLKNTDIPICLAVGKQPSL